MRDTFDTTAIQPGWEVYGSDEEHLGTVDHVGQGFLVIQKGFFFPKDVYVPFSAVTAADETGVILDVTKSEVDSKGWDEPPTDVDGGAWPAGGTSASGSAMGGAAMAGSTTDDVDVGRERIALHEEQLEARKTTRKAGEVEVRKNVVEDEQSFEIPVAREEVRVRRVPASGAATTGDASFTDAGDTIRVPVMEEDVEVTKRPVVREEIEIEKVVRQDTERVGDTVRREEVEVSGDATTVDDDERASLRADGAMDEQGNYRR